MGKTLVSKIENAVLSLGFGMWGEFLTYITANDIINHSLNLDPKILSYMGLTGISGLILSAMFGTNFYNSFKQEPQ
jgi:hypothetical protein